MPGPFIGGSPAQLAPDPPAQQRERRTTSRRRWKDALPTGYANDNAAPGHAASARRAVTLEELLHWTYGRQKADRELRGGIDWVHWALDRATDIELPPRDRRFVAFDAALVHEAVLALPHQVALMVIQAARTNDWPQEIAETPLPYPVEYDSELHDDRGRHVRGDGTRLEYAIVHTEILSIAREEYEQVGRKKMRRAKAVSYDRVPVRFCPIRWLPEPYFIEAENARFAVWRWARPWLRRRLRQAGFRAHVLQN